MRRAINWQEIIINEQENVLYLTFNVFILVVGLHLCHLELTKAKRKTSRIEISILFALYVMRIEK